MDHTIAGGTQTQFSRLDLYELCATADHRFAYLPYNPTRAQRAWMARASRTCRGFGDATTRRCPLSPSLFTVQPFSFACL